jgi:hypothetical protein
VSGELYVQGSVPVPTAQETGWAPESVWKILRTEKSLDPAEIGTPDRPVRSLVSEHAIPVPEYNLYGRK